MFLHLPMFMRARACVCAHEHVQLSVSTSAWLRFLLVPRAHACCGFSILCARIPSNVYNYQTCAPLLLLALILYVSVVNKTWCLISHVQFLVIWRFFRTVALADGIIPPENMGRCVCNNYDIEVGGLSRLFSATPSPLLLSPKSSLYWKLAAAVCGLAPRSPETKFLFPS